MRARRARRRREDPAMTADGVINAVLLALAVVTAVYLMVALIFPERF
ncbi:potassium-transporting ATPase subunit F [Gordonia polyisoprenivorans NBRC 16320 = JCM 10675]|nr:potassium-transporting ATPase subunit F [Gordonia polyisoprenivorans NBRC 16320 = JCM 10675]